MKEKRFGPLKLNKIDEGWVVVSCNPEASTAHVPAKIGDEPVVAIGDHAFSGCGILREVTFDSTEAFVEADAFGFQIREYAFENCISLLRISLPWIVTSVHRGAFYGCSMLGKVEMPDCYVGPYAFCGCERLVKIPELTYISEGVFSHCEALSTFPVKNGCHTIDEDAFYHCYGLVDITIPASVVRIEPLAFRSCYNLRRVTFECPDGWRAKNRYMSGEARLDLSDPIKNAERLSKMDFDDGVSGWFRQE